MRVLITGSRHWTDRATIRDAITAATRAVPASEVTIVHGDCPYGGADLIAADVATELGMRVEAHPADWKRLGKAAGPHRNQLMVDRGADVCLAFPEQGSRGTWDCVRRARTAGIPVTVN
ncbi:DUF2493 domain-containing protein [Gordonia otitidis]|uniref:YspA cpYpsA-related SLOG domain-containing protein n=1 Tax=Gordonia otitidis (strain DSM 44809 / CCUG 52243 / JCM 12355 / NBRC 100426 / IFM 10032) TaxID=1108044 RepID=H5TSL1_GORO1|nr:DUF2493 domain-containing protein [Gordonia otitidis]GAB36469.1 hypothetical protein GOOTI_221_00120 [Gordonia otitidis NBRC 100426]